MKTAALRSRSVAASVLAFATLLATAGSSRAQDSAQPREFAEFRGTWVLDEKTTEELRYVKTRLGDTHPVDNIGLNVARKLVITSTQTEITVAKDGDLPAVYKFDGSETRTKDPRTGAEFTPRYSFALVAEALALTAKREMSPDADGRIRTEIVTDAYALRDFNTLIVERQLSVLVQPPGSLMTLARLRNNKTTFIYRRQ